MEEGRTSDHTEDDFVPYQGTHFALIHLITKLDERYGGVQALTDQRLASYER
jgi:hypothetical protein